jgi:pseudaminic acid synthase
MKRFVSIGDSTIGPGQSSYIVAELSANHGGSYDKAEELVHKASQSGANAVKLQTYTADTMTIDCRKERFLHGAESIWAGLSLYELYEKAHTPWEWHPKLKKVANDLGMELFSSPFDFTSVDFLEELDVPAYKIASFEIIDLPLIEYVASKKKPLIISTGMATVSEISEAIQCVEASGNDEIILLRCVSSYPATFKDMNLKTIPHMQQTFRCPVGLSDHSRGITAPLAAVALGACVIEKHFTLSKSYNTFDRKFSLDPQEFSEMVVAVRNAEKCFGEVAYGPRVAEEESESFRRSLYITKDLKKGDILTEKNCRSIRPGGGLKPRYLDIVMGKKITRDAEMGTPLSWDLLIQ